MFSEKGSISSVIFSFLGSLIWSALLAILSSNIKFLLNMFVPGLTFCLLIFSKSNKSHVFLLYVQGRTSNLFLDFLGNV